MAPWINFFTLTGGAAATLVGLMFIAVTFGQKLVTPETVNMARDILTPIFFHFAHVFMVACVALIPNDGVHIVAIISIAVALLRLTHFPNLIRTLKKAKQTGGHIETSDWLYSLASPALIYVLMIVSGVASFTGSVWGIYGIATGVIALLLLGILAAWDMLIWMATRVQ